MQIENLDHLGLVAGLIDELGLVELTDEQIEPHCLEHVSAGQVVKAMILNALGFLSAPLYLFSEFFESKAVSHLLGAEVEAHHLNDDRLGRVLDELYAAGTTSFFLKVALQAVKRFEIDIQQRHLDATSISVQGEYPPPCEAGAEARPELKPSSETLAEPTPLRLCRGYSRDHRPDLKQFLMTLVCAADGGVPLWLQVASGNEHDTQQFARVMKAFGDQWTSDGIFVMDAAFYSEPNLQQVGSLGWLSRVPLTLSAAQDLVHCEVTTLVEVPTGRKDYRMWEVEQTYGEVPQRWILVESQTRKANAALWQPELDKLESRLNRQLKSLTQQVFACKPDALEALMQFQDGLEIHQLTQVSVQSVRAKRPPGRPAKSAELTPVQGYRLQATLARTATAEDTLSRQRSRFILATNQLDKTLWPAPKCLSEYKGQQSVERGFRFLKDPLFFASSVFVKKPQRVEALALIMALTLMVYTLAERKLRQALAAQHQTVHDQRKQPTAKPTFRWIMQKFQGIHWVTLDGQRLISNLNDERRLIIHLLGPPVERYYHASG
ncbi:IS1634 family transposase [Romeria aff. gracilis LEGE 07310]|uniref:IS1634 family transposase n=1 Tax=Vasconcelosia minhoensis LEGE 07310 TaxID=915328 RepID=A0A8J7AN60_9CYAN|nr:IS1634 family transposase [Romeria gracilis]MBE9077604.1 IS1634 family transposase [Romeria aff. gracilis LEGE 07310]